MPRPYSMDLRERVVSAVNDEGLSRHEASARFGIAPSTAIHWLKRANTTGSVAPKRVGGYKPATLSGRHRDGLLERTKSDFTLRGLVAELADRGVRVDYRSVWRFVHAEGLSFKKSLMASEQDRPKIARRRQQWRKYQGQLDPERLVFIDETWAKTNMAALRGWCARGQRLCAKAPFGHWKTMTFLAALRCDRIDAPCVVDGPINGLSFGLYVERFLLPTLKPGDVVIMDNLGSHKSPFVRKTIRSAGAKLLFLPPYSPDLNPIEQVFAKLKHLMRKAAERTVEATWKRIGALIDAFTPQECRHYLKNSGYGDN